MSLPGWLGFAPLSALAFLAIAFLWFSSAWAAPTTRWIGVGGDGPDFVWYLAWMPYAISHLANPLFTTALNYPHGANLAWDTGAPLLTLLFAPLTIVAGPIFAYNSITTLGVAVTAWSVAMATRRWVTHPGAAFFSGLLFLMAPYIAGQALEHPFMVFFPFVPLTMIWVDWAVVKQHGSELGAGLLLAGLVAGEFYCSEELAVDLVLVLTIGLICLWASTGFQRLAATGRLLRIGAVAGAAVAAATAPYLVWQLLGPDAISGPIMPPLLFSARLLGYLVPALPQSFSLPSLYGIIEGNGFSVFEWGTYVGIPALALIAVLAWRGRSDHLVRTLVMLLVVVMVLSLGGVAHVTGASTGVPLPGALLLHLPILNSLLPVRLAGFVDVIVAVLVGLSLDRATQWSRPWLAPIAVLLVALSWLPRVPFPATAVPTPPIFAHASVLAGQRLLVVPFSQNWLTSQPMLWQAEADMSFSMVDGYYTRVSGVSKSGRPRPFSHGPPLNPLTWDLWTLEHDGAPPSGLTRAQLGFSPIAHWRRSGKHSQWRATVLVDTSLKRFVGHYLDGHRVTMVVLGPSAGWSALERFLTEVLGRPPHRVGGVEVWTHPRDSTWSQELAA